jgi:hypothetical protein
MRHPSALRQDYHAHMMRIIGESHGYDRAAPKRPVNMTLNEDLVRRVRGLTANLCNGGKSVGRSVDHA